jgi:hypothetical protein
MDIFKQAIAEAKAVREAAISNAREAMEESLTPHLKNMLAAKLQEMEEAENEDLMHEAEEEEVEDTEDAEVEDSEDEEPAEDDAEESEDEAEEELDVDEMELEDLKNLIRDIVAQEMEVGDTGMGDLEDEEGGVEDMIDTDMDAEMEPEMDAEMGPEDDEEINLDELIAELESLEEGEEEIEEAKTNTTKKEKVQKMKGGTDEKMKTVTAGKKHLSETKQLLRKAYSTIETLRNDLSEVNLLNSKLLYVSKILKAHNLSESQKVNLIATFDKAETIKEVKLVFETVSENINQASKKVQKNRQPLREHKSFASKPAGKSTRGKIISEANEQVLRMQKLAGIIK